MTDRICEWDGCDYTADASGMMQIGDSWFCPTHGDIVNEEDTK